MLGPEGVAALLVSRFTQALPGKIVQLRERYGITARDLPDTLVLAAEPEDTKLELARFPVVFLVERDTPRVGQPNKVQGGWEYRISYNLSVAYFVRDASVAATTAQRRRLGLAVREVLLERPYLQAADEREGITFDTGNWLERFTAAAAAGGGGVIGGGELAGQWAAAEYLPTPTAQWGFTPHGYTQTVLLKGAPGTPDVDPNPQPVAPPDPGNDDPDLPL